ncbi:taurine catabolism dioxygenase [Grosmannia clavigera kw1407]|uniref:Taurine catabolism dioxygenase n=1 Tax=Grosmannia clavigera (strain kw1407 / UAMH 11150) TaxID=655863 RepID=F0XB98_GROCL|nr:taurine catabolism dioxygenase [Grosmannia clavigera kw1407]EFX05042.1 taurine catabolism dioxygenase [Grosmannia clavigera kw1407]
MSSSERKPLAYSGTLDSYESFDVTPTIGREFSHLQLCSLLSDDAKIRDLAVLVSQRGVVFFRNQDLKPFDQREVVQKLGQLSGKPQTSKGKAAEAAGKTLPDGEPKPDEVLVITSEVLALVNKDSITFENVPSDYAILKMNIAPETGGDTIWASGYEAYDRLSPAWKKLAEGLTATHRNRAAAEVDAQYIGENRGSPENAGLDFEATHLMAAGHQLHDGEFIGLTPREDEILKAYFLQIVVENHDLQVRFKWNTNDIAIWDNRSCFHTATFDYATKREGSRYVSIGEKPYLDPRLPSRREALSRLIFAMAPEATESVPVASKGSRLAPLKLGSVLDQFYSRELTPVIGTKFYNVDLGSLDNNLQKVLVQRLGELVRKPGTSKLHIHPTVNIGRDAAGVAKDKEISVIDSTRGRIIFRGVQDRETPRQGLTTRWQVVARFLASHIQLPPLDSQKKWEIDRLARVGDGQPFFKVAPYFEEYFEALRELAGEPVPGTKGRRLPKWNPAWLDVADQTMEKRIARWRATALFDARQLAEDEAQENHKEREGQARL